MNRTFRHGWGGCAAAMTAGIGLLRGPSRRGRRSYTNQDFVHGVGRNDGRRLVAAPLVALSSRRALGLPWPGSAQGTSPQAGRNGGSPLTRTGLPGPRPAGRLRRSRLTAPSGLLLIFLWRAKTTSRSDGGTQRGPQGEDPLGRIRIKSKAPRRAKQTLEPAQPTLSSSSPLAVPGHPSLLGTV